jgi:hypothetical protein
MSTNLPKTNSRRKIRTQENGAFFWENWKAALSGKTLMGTYEYPLFTDTRITGEISSNLGPYKLLNAVPTVQTDLLLPYSVLRMEWYATKTEEVWSRTNVERYHGGLLEDEIAALVSLCLGVRMKSGGISRVFEIDKDPLGRPTAWEIERNPISLSRLRNETILPQAFGQHSLDDAAPIRDLHLLTARESVAVVRSARLYQDALWVGESEPELSWLLFVSAIETAAGHWRVTRDSPRDRMRASRPELEELLKEHGGENLVSQVAVMIADYMGATKKFVDFVMEFRPDAPKQRPPKGFQLSWDSDDMAKSLRKIYGWRSRALHGGIPFPAPMCRAPARHKDAFDEVSMGRAMSTKGAVWLAEDTPMLLHVFEHIVRHSLLNWWREIIRSKKITRTAVE